MGNGPIGFPYLPVDKIQDYSAQQCIIRLVAWLKANAQLANFNFYTITFTQAQTNFLFPHNLGFQPQDIVMTSLTGTGTLTFNYSLFDSTNLNISTTGPCVVRFLAGTIQGASS